MDVFLKFVGGLCESDWAWLTDEINLRCVGTSRVCMPNPSIAAFIVFEITAFIRTDGQMDSRTWLDRLD